MWRKSTKSTLSYAELDTDKRKADSEEMSYGQTHYSLASQ